MSFDPNDPRITAYVLGELDADERKAFESALSASGDLQQAVQATRQATERLACELRTEPSASLSDPQRESVLRAARERDAHPSAASVSTGRRRKWVFGGVAIAASLLGLCWGGSLLYRVAGERQQVVARASGMLPAHDARVEAEGWSAAPAPQATASTSGAAPAPEGSEGFPFADLPAQNEWAAPATTAERRLRENAPSDAYRAVAPSSYGGAVTASGPAPAGGAGMMGGMPGAGPAPGDPMSLESSMGAGGYPGMAPGMMPGMGPPAPVQLSLDADGQYGMPGMPSVRPVKYKMIRFFDLTAEPGKTYRYRVRVMMEDPNRPQNKAAEPNPRILDQAVADRLAKVTAEDEDVAKKTGKERRTYWLQTEWSEPSEPVTPLSPENFVGGGATGPRFIKRAKRMDR